MPHKWSLIILLIISFIATDLKFEIPDLGSKKIEPEKFRFLVPVLYFYFTSFPIRIPDRYEGRLRYPDIKDVRQDVTRKSLVRKFLRIRTVSSLT